MFTDHIEEIRAAIAGHPAGKTFILSELLGDRWEVIGQDPRPQKVGEKFSEAVDKGMFPGVEFDHVQRSPRVSVYKKVR
ncbi:DUF1413 domain-containing protein [Maritimibacter sp. 55A14]|uniref:DUF1413 domain-containing protein n=1 Tax=Maritimibacter sp. 55A14 TaxID=2174844 RepID=UPI0011B2454C|nr:DUF1413 domain-containing protein [Maritimibacter sp. 55A14]